jgi:hypothetical protein
MPFHLCLAALTGLAAPAPVQAQVQTQAPALPPAPALPLLPGWRAERLEFPLTFAPTLPYAGVEDLRFSPGMFKRGAPDYFAYAFQWWLAGSPVFTPASLERDLEAYYRGLMASVAKDKGLVVDPASTHAAVKALGPGQFRAFLNTEDAFNGGAPVDLIINIQVGKPVKGFRAVRFTVAPSKAEREILDILETLVKPPPRAKR